MMVKFGRSDWISGIWVDILIFTNSSRAGTLSSRVRDATGGVAAVRALPLGFLVKLG